MNRRKLSVGLRNLGIEVTALGDGSCTVKNLLTTSAKLQITDGHGTSEIVVARRGEKQFNLPDGSSLYKVYPQQGGRNRLRLIGVRPEAAGTVEVDPHLEKPNALEALTRATVSDTATGGDGSNMDA